MPIVDAFDTARRGWAYLQLEDFGKAKADFDKAMALAPRDEYAQNGLASLSAAEQTRSRAAIHRDELR